MISVLTEPDAFSGSMESAARRPTRQATMPVIAQGLPVEPYQVFEAGARAPMASS